MISCVAKQGITMKAGFVISLCLPLLMMMMIMNDCFWCVSQTSGVGFSPHHNPDIRQKYLFHVGSRDFFLARDVCFFLINLSGARPRLLICSVWTDLNTKIKIFKIRRQNPEPEPPPTLAPTLRGLEIQKFLPHPKMQTCSPTHSVSCRKYKRFSWVNTGRAQFMFCSEERSVGL